MKYGYVINNEKYIFYYDESNNIRVFSIKKNNFNVDNNPQNPYSPIFILGGIVKKEIYSESDISLDFFKKLLSLPENINEVKLKNIAKGDFLEVLNSPKIFKFLTWMYNSNFYLQYFAVNTVYWSFVDIIDDAIHYFMNSEENYNIDRFSVDQYKNALYLLIKKDKKSFIELIKKFSYPNISKGQESFFYRELHKLARKNNNINLPVEKREKNEINNKIIGLTSFLSKCKNINNVDFTFDDKTDILIDSFATFYITRINGFKNSKHILDKENTIEPEIISITKHSNIGNDENPFFGIDFKFVDSTESIEIQISDITSGIIRLLFSFIEESNQENIQAFLDSATTQQLDNLKILYKNIEKSYSECKGFIFRVQVPDDEIKMYKLFNS